MNGHPWPFSAGALLDGRYSSVVATYNRIKYFVLKHIVCQVQETFLELFSDLSKSFVRAWHSNVLKSFLELGICCVLKHIHKLSLCGASSIGLLLGKLPLVSKGYTYLSIQLFKCPISTDITSDATVERSLEGSLGDHTQDNLVLYTSVSRTYTAEHNSESPGTDLAGVFLQVLFGANILSKGFIDL